MVDVRGLSCPMPVMMVQKATKDSPAQVEVLADCKTAVGNVTRFAESQGYTITVTPDGNEYRMELKK